MCAAVRSAAPLPLPAVLPGGDVRAVRAPGPRSERARRQAAVAVRVVALVTDSFPMPA